ncbi:histidine kinase [Methylosinus sp. Sm6]|uniref:histidine kinase n=1 Tax=Methylosinus sp. Sm6 TaxID=2866948 RepID=UPI001C994D5D|nr:histidine kinase [Methylosinus sp. Sm6]MBY6240751.1 HAMP domain-containing protein [Methylosinus sp. Sm6]
MRARSLKSGLSRLVGVVLVMTFLVNVAVLVLHAGPRIRAEDETTVRLTHELLATALASLQETADPAPALRRFYESLGALRHVDIKIVKNEDAASLARLRPKARAESGVPDWFVALVDAPTRVSILRLGMLPSALMRGADDGRIAIVSNPIDELAEIWADVSWLAFISLSVTVTFFGVVLVFVRSSLKPFEGMRRALADLEAGKTNVRVAPHGAEEFRSIADALNSLAATLDHVKAENRRLLNELIRVQDKERKEIARDLHDEAGPCLFSIRAGAVTLLDIAASPAPDIARLRRACFDVDKASEAIQTLVRSLLDRLRPRGLAEFGLGAAVEDLIASWRASRPDVVCELVSPHDLSSLDEPTASTAYRVVQEATTNIYRHARAKFAEIRIEFASLPLFADGESEQECAPGLQITVEDDGVGLPDRHRFGHGLSGMRERVQALGGRMAIENGRLGGARISVALPIQELEDEDDG